MSEQLIAAGSRVCLTGLKQRATLNGHYGTAMKFIEDKLRYAVKVEDGEEVLLVKAQNLVVASAAKKKTKVPDRSLDSVEKVLEPSTGQITEKTAADYGGEGSGGMYRWGQNHSEVILQTLLPSGIKSHDICFEPAKTHFKLSVCDQTMLDGRTFAAIVPADSSFTLEDEPDDEGRRLTVTLAKARPTAGKQHWKCVVQGEPEIDVEKFEKEVRFGGGPRHGGDSRMCLMPHDPLQEAAMQEADEDEDEDEDEVSQGPVSSSGAASEDSS